MELMEEEVEGVGEGLMVGLSGTLTDPRPAGPGQVEQSIMAAAGCGAGIVVSGAGSMSASGAFGTAPASPGLPLLPLLSSFTPDFDSATHKAESEHRDINDNQLSTRKTQQAEFNCSTLGQN